MKITPPIFLKLNYQNFVFELTKYLALSIPIIDIKKVSRVLISLSWLEGVHGWGVQNTPQRKHLNIHHAQTLSVQQRIVNGKLDAKKSETLP